MSAPGAFAIRVGAVAGMVAGVVALAMSTPTPAYALDPAKTLSECSVETWRSRDGIVGWVRAITQTPDGYLWVGTNAGVFRYGGGTVDGFEAAGPLARAADVVALAVGPDGTLWITPARGAPVCLHGSRGPLTACESAAGAAPAAAPATSITDRDGNLWTTGRHGLTRARPDQPATSARLFTREDGLPEDEVTAVFEDREGSLWVGTRGGGLAQFTDRTLDARLGPPSLRDRWISAVVEAQGALWVGTRTGLVRWQDGVERTLGRRDGLPGDEVLALQPGSDGELWVGTSSGLGRVRDGQIDQPIALAEAVSALHVDDQRTLWLGGLEGVARVREGRLERMPADAGIETGEVRDMQHDPAGTLWLSAGGKLMRVDTPSGRLRLPEGVVAGQEPDPRVVPGKVRALHRGADGTLWLASGDGLWRWRADHWRLFTRAEGLIPDDIYQVVTDDHGFLWVGTNQGVVRVSVAALVAEGRPRLDAVSFHTSDQRRNVEVVRASPGAWKGQGGRLWFATGRGVVGVDPQRLRVNTVPPVVLIEQALVDGRPLARGLPVALPPGAGALEFHFAAITLLEPRKARYRYRLEGFDAGWIEAGGRREAYYTNIGPGSYRFTVIGSNADGVWNGRGDAVAFSLAPHIYETAWFYALAGLGAIALALSFHRLRLARVTGRYLATLAERTRVARELHDGLLQGMAAARLHLQSMRKRVARGAYPRVDAMTGELERIEELIGNNLEETRRYVWDLREQPPGEAAAGLGPALARLVARLAEGAPAPVHLHAEGTPTAVAPHATREVLRIVHEAVTNALKHAQARQIEVRLCYEGDVVKVAVRDDGRGFDPKAAPGAPDGHFGLLGMRERAASLGELRIDSEPGRGTLVEVSIHAQDQASDRGS